MAGCGDSAPTGTSATTTATAADASGYPVTVTSCGAPLTFTTRPTRAVSNDINTTEDMLALGLEKDMVGDFGVTGDGPVGHPVPAEYLPGFRRVPDISPNYFTLEKLVSLRPDFLFAGWNYGLQVGTPLTPQNLAHYGIKTLVLSESCSHVQSSVVSSNIDDTYVDLQHLGAIFDVRQRAAAVIAGMKATVASVSKKVTGLEPVSVFDYDSGESAPFTAPAQALPNALITLGGGRNIFGHLEQSWTSVSWESVVAADPECIIINDYGTPTAAAKEKFLQTDPITQSLTAVKNRCFLVLDYDEVTPSPRNAEAVLAIARWLHPSAYGLPPDGS